MSAERPKWKNTLLATMAITGVYATPVEARPEETYDQNSAPRGIVSTAVLGISETGYQPITEQETQELHQLLLLINRVRAEKGSKQLEVSSRISEVAQLRALDIAEEGRLSHCKTEPCTPENAEAFRLLDQKGVKRWAAGEILGYGSSSNPQLFGELVQAWLASPTHEKVIERPWFTHFGFGIADSEQGSRFIAVIFISTSE